MTDKPFRWGDPIPRHRPRERRADRELLVLIVVAVLSIVLWQIPYGNLVVYPFTILSTWFHEMGHGIGALLVGGSFKRLDVFADGSGLAYHALPVSGGAGLRRAFVAGAGPLGPAVAGAIFIRLSPQARLSRGALGLLGATMLLSVVIWIRTPFGMAFIGLLGVALVAMAAKASEGVAHFVVNLLGVQACISTYRQIDYLFTREVEIAGRTMLSDTGRMSEVLLLPHWAWAAMIIVVSVVLLAWSLRAAYRPGRA